MTPYVCITGANRGIGLGLARHFARQDYALILCGRSLSELESVSRDLAHPAMLCVEMDLNQTQTIEAAAQKILPQCPHLDILINNAGVFLDENYAQPDIFHVEEAAYLESFRVNCLGSLWFSRALHPLLKKASHPCIINVSSEMGSVSPPHHADHPSYRISKAALNMLTGILSEAFKPDGIAVNAVSPGWVRTRMGGAKASRSITEGVESVLRAIPSPDQSGLTGTFSRDGQPLHW